MSYKILSLVQVVFISLAAISVFDYGFTIAEGGVAGNNDGIMFNKILFGDDGPLGFLKDVTLWGELQFWAYCFLIVAICQLIKALTVKI